MDFGKVMERMRRLRASISPTDSCDRFQNQLGIDVFQVHKAFSDDKYTCIHVYVHQYQESCDQNTSQCVNRVFSALIKLQLCLIPVRHRQNLLPPADSTVYRCHAECQVHSAVCIVCSGQILKDM